MKKHLARLSLFVFALASTVNALGVSIPNPIDPGLSCSVPTIKVIDPIVVYGDQLRDGFHLNVWGGQNTTTSDNPYQGNNAIYMSFNSGWSGIEFRSTTLLNSDTVGGIRVAVRGGSSGQNIRVYLLTDDWKKLGIDVPLHKYVVHEDVTDNWQVAYIPLEDMMIRQSISIGGLGFQSEFTGELFIDDVQIHPVEPNGLVTLYDDNPRAKMHHWLSNTIADTVNPFHGGSAIKATITNDWGGFTLHTQEPLSENTFGAITFAVKGSLSGQELYVYPVNENGEKIGLARPVSAYLHGGAIPSDWQVAWVPLNDLIARPVSGVYTFNGIGIEATMPGTVWVDEVKVVEKLRWPLPGVAKELTSPFGDHWQERYCGGVHRQLHTAEDYSSEQTGGKTVVAAHHGTVRYVMKDEWGGYVVMESKGEAFTTTYVHIDYSVAVGEEVWPGKVIGSTSYITNPHLHFTLRMAPFPETDVNRALRGRLPEGVDCEGDPAFPEKFIDPKLIYWQ